MDPFSIAMILMALGTAVNYQNTKKTQNRTQSAILRAQQRQTDLNKKAQQETVDFAKETYDPEQRAVNEEEAAVNAQANLITEVLASRDRGMGDTATTGGATTTDYSTDRAKTMMNTLGRAAKLAQLIGKVRGPTDLRFHEGINTGRLGGDLADLQSLGQSRAATDQGLIQIASMADPRLSALGGLMQSVGTNMAMANVGGMARGASFGETTIPKGAFGQSSIYRAPPGTF